MSFWLCPESLKLFCSQVVLVLETFSDQLHSVKKAFQASKTFQTFSASFFQCSREERNLLAYSITSIILFLTSGRRGTQEEFQ